MYCKISCVIPATRIQVLTLALFVWSFFCVQAKSQPFNFQRLDGCALNAGQFSGLENSTRFYSRTGNQEIDQAFRAEVRLLESAFQVRPSFVFYDDNISPGAYASSNGIVAFGLNLVQNQFRQASLGGPLGIAAIMAHEYAHIAQFKSGTPSNTDRIKYRELHADFMAGWYLAGRQSYLATDILDGLRTMHSLGDRQFYSLDHHGTHEERLIATLVGVTSSNNLNMREAYDRGFEYVGVAYRLSGVPELTPLLWAVTSGYSDTVHALLAFGVDSNEARFQTRITPLHMAAALGNVEIVEKLLAARANPNSNAVDGSTALHLAVLDQETISRGFSSLTRLQMTVRKSSGAMVWIVRNLLEHGANPNAVGRSGGTPLHFAAYLGDVAIVQELLEGGANPWIRANDGSTPLRALDDSNANDSDKAQIVTLLVRYGKDWPESRR